MEARTLGVHHVGLTVLDVEEARDWFVDVLGLRVVGGRPSYPAVFLSDGAVMLTLWQVEDRARALPYDRKLGVGLHHLALRVATADALEELHGVLSQRADTEVEFAPEALGDAGARHMMCSGPSGVRLELIWAPA